MGRQSLKNICRLLDETSRTVPIEESFLSDLQRSIELTDSKNTRLPSKTYKPSSMNCIRNMWYQRMGFNQDDGTTPYALVGICNSGTDIHARIQQAVIDMQSNGIDCEYINVADFVEYRHLGYLEIVKRPDFENGDYETKLFHRDLNMSFLCDGIIKYKNHYYILELKTESSYKWQDRKGVDPKHYNQGTAYSVAFGIDEVIFVYISRDNLTMKSFLFVPTTDMKEELTSKIISCEEYVISNKCPPKPDNVIRTACQYCSYKTLCKNN